jgi:glutamate synthase (NADPH/NADH) small chain
MADKKPKKIKVPRAKMPEQDPDVRKRNFKEVPLGLTPEMAMEEASRCLQCKKPLCVDGCPVSVKIPEFIKLIAEEDFSGAAKKLWETNALPAVCGRVCPQEDQCEGKCIVGKKGDPVAIGMLERFLVDWMVANKKNMLKPCAMPKDKKVAIVGSGPAGMACGFYLAHDGYHCTIYESLPAFGGMLTVGIPAYRLPRDIINTEFDALVNCGVKIVNNVTIGKDKTLQQLKDEGYGAVFVAIGAHASRKLGVEGEDLEGVMHGVDYLRRVNLGEALNLGNNVVVIGGGNVAIDVARTALRTGSDKVFILYRRTKKEMPASQAEIHHLEEEGVKVEFLAAPVKIHGENGKLTKIECLRMKLGESDASGRCRPVPIDGSNFMIEADAIIPAISQNVEHISESDIKIKLSRWNTFEVDEITMQSSVDWIFAGGDAVLGPQTAAKAAYQGKEAAKSIIRYLEGRDLKEGRIPEPEEKEK